MSKELTITGDIVFSQGGEVFTTSLIVAEVFEKEHKNVMRAIENLECAPEFTRLNFELSEYADSTGRKGLKCYRITKKGFMRLAMRFTGPKAERPKRLDSKSRDEGCHPLHSGSNGITASPDSVKLGAWLKGCALFLCLK
jgi:Rha family phage regulatory protein